MEHRERPVLAWINLVLLVVVALLLVLLLWRTWQVGEAPPVTSRVHVEQVIMAATVPTERMVSRREVAVGGVRPVSFLPPAGRSSAREAWVLRGVEAQEWSRLPASPGMDMAESEESYLLTFSLPGVRDDDIRLTMTGRVMSVQAKLRDEQGNQVGGVERRVLLPHTSGGASVSFTARYTNGTLRVCVAK
jgi:HSP20 family molecular chaperone IbpA